MTRHLGDDWLLPAIDDLNRPWFTEGTLQVQQCGDCDTLQHPPDEVCCGCQGTNLGFRECRGQGHIESVAIVHQAVHPGLKDALPYAVVVVSIDDAPGVNAIGNVLNREPSQVEIGQAVRAVFEDVEPADGGERLLVPQWEVV
jgi:uncharacterized OB-fold protein